MILAIETSSKNCSVSFGHPENCLFTKELASTEYVHNEMLHVFIHEAMRELQIQPRDLTAIAVGLGPGSYTGLRIGMAAAKGFAHPLRIPIIGFDAAAILRASVDSDLEKVIVIDARRMDAFVHMNNAWSFQTLTSDFRESLGVNPIHFIGDGAEKMREFLKRGDTISNRYPSSKFMFHSLKEIPAFDMNVLNIEPLYLKEFEVHTTPKNKL